MKFAKGFFIGLMGLSFVALAGCKEIRTPDGKIPADAEAQVSEYLGEYYGDFDGEKGTITLSLENLEPKVTFVSDSGSADLLDESCGSQIGRMYSYNVKEKDNGEYAVKYITLGFDSGKCKSVKGRQLTIKFSRKDSGQLKLNLSILHYTDSYRMCIGLDSCFDQTTYHYLEGKFGKK